MRVLRSNREAAYTRVFETRSIPEMNELVYDVTEAVRGEAASPCIGRREKVLSIAEALDGAGAKRLLIIGERGTGKTNFVEGAAWSLARGDGHGDVRILQLNAGALFADTARIYELTHQLLASLRQDFNQILFIEDITPFLAPGPGASTSIQEVAGAVADSEISVIGSVEPSTYEQLLGRSPEAISDIPVTRLEPMSKRESLTVLDELKGRIEEREGVQISSAAVRAAVKMSADYLSDYKLPGKAIEVLTRACRRYQLKSDLEIADSDWIDEASMRHLGRKVSSHDVKRAIGEMTAIDIDADQAAAWKRKIQERIEQIVLGQAPAVVKVAEAASRMLVDLGATGKAAGVYSFLGPKGVGKTSLARALATALTGAEDDVTVIDLSQYASAERMNGFLGYTRALGGNVENGELPIAVRGRSFSVVVLQNPEKAHADFFVALEQIMETGVLRDDSGHKVRFNHCLLVLISEVPAAAALEDIPEEELVTLASRIVPKKIARRLDATIAFSYLVRATAEEITRRGIRQFRKKIKAGKIVLRVDRDTFAYLVAKGFTRENGAGGLKKLLTEVVHTPINGFLQSNHVPEGSILILTEAGKEIEMRSPAPGND